MGSLQSGKLFAFFAFVVALGVANGILVTALDLPWWVASLAMFVVVLLAAFAVRRMETGRWSYERRSWAGEEDARQVELVFDEKLVVLNRLTLRVDGKEVDRDTIFYGFKELSGDGVTVRVGSGWMGECIGAVVVGGMQERPLTERA